MPERNDTFINLRFLRDINKPIGVAGWETKLVEKLPVDFQGSLPTVEEIEAELAGSVPLKPERKKET